MKAVTGRSSACSVASALGLRRLHKMPVFRTFTDDGQPNMEGSSIN